MNTKSHTILASLKCMQQEGILTDFKIVNRSQSIEVFTNTIFDFLKLLNEYIW